MFHELALQAYFIHVFHKRNSYETHIKMMPNTKHNTMSPSEKLVEWYSSLSMETLQDIHLHYAKEAYFKDPFNEVRSANAIKQIFTHMFEHTENPRFIVSKTIQQEHHAFLIWDFHFALNGKEYLIHGTSHIVFDEEDKVVIHRDYWDAAEELWAKIPILGKFIQWLRKKFKVSIVS
jgi:hypothetical protein